MQEEEISYEESGEEALQLDPYVIKEKQSTYTSLTDRYGILVFTNRFRQNREQVELQIAGQDGQLMQDIFSGRYIPEEQTANGLESILFIQEKEQVILQEHAEDSASNTLWYGPVTVGACLLFSALLLQYHRKKKKAREEHVADIKLVHPATEPAAGHTGQ